MLSFAETEGLVGWYVDTLLGRRTPIVSHKDVGQIPAWSDRAHAIAAFQKSIDEALVLYADSRSSTDLYKRRTTAEFVSCLRTRWGLGKYPERSVIEVDATTIGHSTLRNWEAAAYSSEVFRSGLERGLVARLSESTSDSGSWLEGLPTEFPPASASLTSMLEIARNAGLDGDDRSLIQTVRQTVSLRVRTYLAAQPRHLIHHREVVESSWFRSDVQFIEPVRGALSKDLVIQGHAERGQSLAVSRAVVTLQYFLCLLDPRSFTRQLQATAGTRASFRMFLRREGPRPLILARAVTLASLSQTTSHRHIDPSSPAGEAIDMAYAIRAAPQSQRGLLIREFARLRREIQPHLGSYSDEYLRTVMQADQSASHDAMDAMDEHGFREVDSLRVAAGRGSSMGAYPVMTWRDRGVLASKQGRLASAIRITDRGIDKLLSLDPAQRGDGHAFLESLHQHLLSNAGTAAKIVEDLLVEIPQKQSLRRSIRVYERWAETAVSYASRAHSVLEQLEGIMPGGLPVKRHEDGYIASRDWRIQTRIMYLRALLGAETLLATVQSEKHRATIVDREIMRILYREIASDPRLRRPRIFTFTQLAVWLTLIDGMELPYIENPSIGLSEVPFLTVNSNAVLPGNRAVSMDEERVIRAKFWFDQADGWDRGPITRVRAGTAVAQFLSRKSGRISEIWLRDDN